MRENLTVAADHPSVGTAIKQLLGGAAPRSDAMDEALEVFGLGALADVTPSEITQGQRKLVAVARALAARPTLLCLDEPAAGLDAESVTFGRHLRDIVDRGTPTLLIDHDMGLVLGICDYVVVLEFGKVIARGTPVRCAPMPTSSRLPGLGGHGAGGGGLMGDPVPVLELDGLSAGYGAAAVVRGLDLHVHAGEVVALLGPNGPGRRRPCVPSRASSARWPA